MPTPDALASWLLAVSWQLLPLTAVVIILDLALRRAGPVVRSALWWMVLAKLIVPPGLASPLSIAQLWPVDGIYVAVAENPLTPDPSNREGGGMDLAGAASAGSLSPPLTTTYAAAPEARSGWTDLGQALINGRQIGYWLATFLPRKLNRASGAAMLLALWGTGAIAAGVLAGWRYRRVRAACLDGAVLLTDAAQETRSGKALGLSLESNRASGAASDVHAIAVAAARQLGLPALPRIFVAAHGAGLPAVIGFFAPCVVLPRALLERPRGEIEHVLLHELAHVRRGDPLTSLICLVAQIVFWFHPAIWCARRRLATLREMACDRTVARLLGDATPAYRRTLILLARSASSPFAGGPDAPGALGLFQRQSQLVTRLDALARPVSMRRATERAAGTAIALAILISCVPLASSRGAPTASTDVPPLDALSGSLQKRYAVMRALALEQQAQAPPQPPR